MPLTDGAVSDSDDDFLGGFSGFRELADREFWRGPRGSGPGGV